MALKIVKSIIFKVENCNGGLCNQKTATHSTIRILLENVLPLFLAAYLACPKNEGKAAIVCNDPRTGNPINNKEVSETMSFYRH